MKTCKRQKGQSSAHPAEAGPMQRPFNQLRGEEGQSMMEMTVGVIFLLLIVLILFEMAMLFYSYIAVLNASREGAVYASLYPVMSATQFQEYQSIAEAEAQAAGLNTTPDFFVVDPPETPDGPEPLNKVVVRVHYQLINQTQGIVLPVFGRLGLFQSVWMTAKTEMPIR